MKVQIARALLRKIELYKNSFTFLDGLSIRLKFFSSFFFSFFHYREFLEAELGADMRQNGTSCAGSLRERLNIVFYPVRSSNFHLSNWANI